MNSKLNRKVARALTATVVGGAAVFAVAAPASAAPAAAGQCTVRDGTSRLGSQFGTNPVKFEFPDSPYVGMRWSSCTNKVVIYYGGYTPGLPGEFYQLRRAETSEQVKVPIGERRTWTINAPGTTIMTISAQYCQKPVIGSSRCTRWSPVVTVKLS
ncbi:hypothetical protein GCM10009609_10280 [Pseudonocardia aurantiaca]|uniref:Secreted protein n=1 Tax=Pseudonocardia aurantiaca TaxID=75290 RepID=A0ABW4FBI8_9PSEU